MPKRNDEKIVFDDSEEDPVAIRDGSDEEDDEEGNEDLSLKILEKALSRRDSDDSKETSMSDLCGSGVVSTVIVNGGNSKGSKKMKGTNPEDAHEISIVSKDQNEDKMVEDLTKGEDDDDEVEVERSAEPKAGETSSNLVFKKLLRGARYFDPPDAGWVSCYSCGEQGHITVNCPTPYKRRKPCFICGSLEHGAKQCSKGHDCYICKNGGHRAKDCPDKYKSGSKTAVCLRCGDSGHDMILCKYEYSQNDLKDIQCYVCKSFGHLCCVEPGNSPSWAVSCYRCGQLGHIGLACGRYYEESTEKESASSCFRCGEEGHFSRECPNSSSISTSHGKDSLSLCYRCNGAGHFARECPNPSQVSKRNRETSTPSHKSSKRNKQNSEHTSPHESNAKMKKKENSEHISTPRESNGKAKKKNKENSEHNSTPLESNGKTTKKKKNKENSEHKSTPRESNGKMKKKKTHKGDHPQNTPQKPKQRGSWMIEDLEEDSFQRGNIRRPRSPITPSGHNHHRLPTTDMGHNHHRLPTTDMGHNHHRLPTTDMGHNHHRLPTTDMGHNHHRLPTTDMGHNHRSPTFNSGGHYPGSQSTTPYGRNHRNSSYESSGHLSDHPPSMWQPYYPSPSHHHHQNQRYALAPSRYGPTHHYGEFPWNYGRW